MGICHDNGYFNESYLIAPVVKEGKVVKTLEVFRVKDNVYFQFSDKDPDANGFFQTLVFTERDKISASVAEGKYASKSGTISTPVCRKFILTVGYVEGAGGEQYPIQETKTICKFVEIALPESDCLGDVDPITGECGGGGPGGYGYPDPPDMDEDPCENIKAKLTSVQFKEKLQNLTNPSNFALDHEVGFFEKNGQFFPAASTPCFYELKATTNVQCISGIMHTHPSADCDGNLKDKTPSPGDIAIFLQIILPQAQSCLGNSQDAYSITVTPWGNYMLKYNNTNLPVNTNYDIDALSAIFDRQIQTLMKNDMYTSQNIEKAFTKFIDDYMNVDGLEVYKVTENSSVKLDYDSATGTTTQTPCPNF